MPALTRRQTLTVAGGGIAALAVASALGGRDLLPGPLGPSHPGQRTAFGRVSVIRAVRGPSGVGLRSHHGRIPTPARAHLDPRHLVWSDQVRVDVQVDNSSRRPVLLSPGQFRLRVGETGPSVSLCDAGVPMVTVPPRTSLTSWVSFLVPPDEAVFGVEYTEAGAATPHAFRIVPEVSLG